jgi:hypothetical protein
LPPGQWEPTGKQMRRPPEAAKSESTLALRPGAHWARTWARGRLPVKWKLKPGRRRGWLATAGVPGTLARYLRLVGGSPSAGQRR